MNDEALIIALQNEAKDLTLLYVEDDLSLCEHTKVILEDFFKEVTICHNGEQGVNAFETRSFDIVLADIVMPVMNGIEMARIMKKQKSEQTIIVMSGYEETQYFMEFIDIGINSFVSKPPNSSELFSILLSASLKINNQKKQREDSSLLEKDLYESKELLRNIIDTIPVRIFWKDKDSNYLGCNKLFANDAGLTEQSALIGKSDFDLSWHDDAQAYVDDDQEVLESLSNKLHYEEKQTTPNGDTIWLSTSKVVLYDKNHEAMGLLGSYIDITEHKQLIDSMKEVEDALGYQAYHDALTRLPNRVLYLKKLEESISRAERAKSKLAVIFIDVDKFKYINDSLGHDTGDKIIQIVGERLHSQLREVDVISRFGGDEFVLLIDGIKDENDLSSVVDKLMHIMDETCKVGEHHLPVTLSMGISMYPDDGLTPKQLIRNADTAMYTAKESGRNRYHFYAKRMTDESMRRLELVKDIRKAIKEEAFVVYYQPQIDANTHELLGLEALVRWQHPDGSLRLPSKFIKLAEDASIIHKIGSLVLNEAAIQLINWKKMGYTTGRLAINCSAIEIEHENFFQHFKESLEKLECKPEWIGLEITEAYMLKHPEASISILQKIKDLGIALAIDDFGTGYCSLSYLRKLPIDTLKIDASFIADVESNESDTSVVESIISLAKTMRFDVMAEGVETQEQEDILVEKGCHKIQGHLYAKPMSAKDMEVFLKEYHLNKRIK